MKKIITLVLLSASLLSFSQKKGERKHKVENILHDRSFWETKPTVETVKQKIAEGNDAVISNRGAFDAVTFAIMAKAPLTTIEYLLSLPGNDINKPTHDGRSYLMWAGYAGDIPTMELLLKKGADVNIAGSHGFTWFTFTLNAGHENTEIYDLMAANGIDLKSTTRTGANAALLLAPRAKDEKLINYFQKKGVDVKAKDNNGNNLLFYAAKSGNVSLIKTYIKKGFDYKSLNTEGENMALFATHGGRGSSNSLEVYQYFDGLGLDMTIINKKGESALHNVASSTKELAVLDFFINKGIDSNLQDAKGNTALLNAVKGNNIVAIEKLTPLVKDINLKNKDGYTALTFATQRINTKAFKMLTTNGANTDVVDANGNNLFYHLFEAYSRRNSKDFEAFANTLKTANVSFVNASKNNPPLHIAIEKGEKKLIEKALELGADINQKNKDGLTPLLLAAMKATDARTLKVLINKGADKKATTDFDETVYDLAKENELLKNTDIAFLK